MNEVTDRHWEIYQELEKRLLAVARRRFPTREQDFMGLALDKILSLSASDLENYHVLAIYNFARDHATQRAWQHDSKMLGLWEFSDLEGDEEIVDPFTVDEEAAFSDFEEFSLAQRLQAVMDTAEGDQREVFTAVLDALDSGDERAIKQNGTVNVAGLAEILGLDKRRVTTAVEDLRGLMSQHDLDDGRMATPAALAATDRSLREQTSADVRGKNVKLARRKEFLSNKNAPTALYFAAMRERGWQPTVSGYC